jgi:hypothetical protein
MPSRRGFKTQPLPLTMGLLVLAAGVIRAQQVKGEPSTSGERSRAPDWSLAAPALIACSDEALPVAVAQLSVQVDSALQRIDSLRDQALVAGSVARAAVGSARFVELADCLLQRRDPDFRRVRAAGYAEFEAYIAREFHGAADAKLLLSVGAAYVAALSANGWLDMELWVDIPLLGVMLRRSAGLAPELDNARALLLLGVLDCARPVAIGGQPGEGLAQLERAAQLTAGQYLTVQVTMAAHCAVTLNERPLFDRLLRGVIAAHTGASFARDNAVAKQRARYLLQHADLVFPD